MMTRLLTFSYFVKMCMSQMDETDDKRLRSTVSTLCLKL